MTKSNSILYFEEEGRKENWPNVLRQVKRLFQQRPEVHSYKVIVYTAIGEGPVAAYNLLQEWDAKIIAVTLPPDFIVVRDGQKVSPKIPPKARAFFDGVQIPVISSRLPFQRIEGATAHNEQMALICDVLSLFGGSFAQGEKVIMITGDSAAIVTASTTAKFLTREEGLSINEIICKARHFTIARGLPTVAAEHSRSLFEEEDARLRLKAPVPKPNQLVQAQDNPAPEETKK
jgi:hypothetical protein